MDTHVLQLSDSFRAILFYNVCHSNNTDQLPVSAEEQRGFSFFRKSFGGFFYLIRYFCILADEVQISATDQRTVYFAGKSVAGYCLEILCVKFL